MPVRHGRLSRRAVIGHPVVRSPTPADSTSLLAQGVARRRERKDPPSTSPVTE